MTLQNQTNYQFTKYHFYVIDSVYKFQCIGQKSPHFLEHQTNRLLFNDKKFILPNQIL